MTDPIELNAELQMVEANIAKLTGEIEIQPAGLSDIEKAMRELQAKLDSYKQQRAEAIQQEQTRRFDLRARIREERQRADGLHRDILMAEQRRKAELAKFEHEAYVDSLTENAPWRGKAFQHQLDGAHYLAAAKRAICADAMGLGKTLQSIMYLDMIGAKKVLILVPGDVAREFGREIERWSPNRFVHVMANQSKMERNFMLKMLKRSNEEEFTILLNYEAWVRDHSLLAKMVDLHLDTVICDEAHILKETNTKAFRGVSEIVFGMNQCPICKSHDLIEVDEVMNCMDCDWKAKDNRGLWTDEDRRSVTNLLMMTGTPILNKPSELFALLHLTYPLVYPTKRDFEREYCQLNYSTGRLEWGWQGEQRIMEKMRGIYIRRTHESAGIVLPPQQQIVHEIKLDKERYPLQADIIKQVREHAQVLVKNLGTIEAIPMVHILALITRERQAVVWPGGIKFRIPVVDELGQPVDDPETGKPMIRIVDVGEDYKQSAVLDAAQDLAFEFIYSEGQRIVIFSQFTTALEEMQARFDKLGVRSVLLTGATPRDLRDEIKTNFDRKYEEEPKWDVVLCNYKTGGVGLNLTACTAQIILDEEWNPGKNQQAYDRIHRIGQTEETSVHIFRMQKTVSMWLADLIQQKAAVIAGFNNAGDELEVNKTTAEQFLNLLQGLGEEVEEDDDEE